MDVRSRSKLLASFFGFLTLSFLVVVVIAFVLLKDHQDSLPQHTYDESGLAAVQVRLHYEMLMGSLAVVEGRQDSAALDDAVLQFDILYERLTALPTRPFYELLLNEEALGIQAEALGALTQLTPRVDRAAEGDMEALRGMRAELSPLRPRIERLAHSPVHVASEHRASIIKKLEDISVWFSWVITGLVVSGVAFALIIWRQQNVAARRQAELEQLTESLKTARDAAEAGSRAKSVFLSHMSHELRTPMNSVLGFAQVLEMGELDDSQTKAVKQILRSGNLLMHLIDQTLELNKIASERVTLSMGEVVPASLVDECFALMSVMSTDKGVALIVEPPQAPVSLMETDANRLQQVLINLLSNAIKYNHQGGRVTLSWFETPDERVRFSVADTGEGIPPGHEDEIFQPFNRLGRENLAIEGTGIGLTITRELVKMLGGEIHYESTLGKGSTFWFDLPLKAL